MYHRIELFFGVAFYVIYTKEKVIMRFTQHEGNNFIFIFALLIHCSFHGCPRSPGGARRTSFVIFIVTPRIFQVLSQWNQTFLYARKHLPWYSPHEVTKDVDWNWEDNCAIFLSRNVVQSLQVSELFNERYIFIIKNVSHQEKWRIWNTWRAAGLEEMIAAAWASALDDLCSPSAAITLARASRAASASAAMARCSCCGRRTSFLDKPKKGWISLWILLSNMKIISLQIHAKFRVNVTKLVGEITKNQAFYFISMPKLWNIIKWESLYVIKYMNSKQNKQIMTLNSNPTDEMCYS